MDADDLRVRNALGQAHLARAHIRESVRSLHLGSQRPVPLETGRATLILVVILCRFPTDVREDRIRVRGPHAPAFKVVLGRVATFKDVICAHSRLRSSRDCYLLFGTNRG